MQEVRYLLELRVPGQQFGDEGGDVGALSGEEEIEFFVLADLDLHG